MSDYKALYRKWRPVDFDDVCGQDGITDILKYEVANSKLSHAYLFCGSRGTGKTSCAKILAKAVNCENPKDGNPCNRCEACRSIDAGIATDVIEMDAASNNGINDVRDMQDEIAFTPALLNYRVYIIDEVHMMSQQAFNALLKTLEEPPAYVIFILATTEYHKLPTTIVSRCQRFDFKRISTSVIMDRLLEIASSEGIEITEDAARIIARVSRGGMRDAISLLELCAGSRLPVTTELVTTTVGATGREGTAAVVSAILKRDYDALFERVDTLVASSRDLAVFWQELIGYYRDMLVVKTTKSPESYLDLTDSELVALRALSDRFTKEMLLYHTGLLEDALFAMQKAFAVKRTVAEITLLRLCDPALDTSYESILARLSRIEEQLVGGVSLPVAQPAPAPTPAVADAPVQSASPAATEPAPVADVKPVEKTPTPAPKPEAPVAERRVLRPLRTWSEAVDRVRATSPMAAAFLMKAKAYTTEDGGVVVKLGSTFERDMVAKEGAPEALRAALSVLLGHKVESDAVCFEVENAPVTGDSLLDLIIEAAEE